jgi:hypothetical protein
MRLWIVALHSSIFSGAGGKFNNICARAIACVAVAGMAGSEA